MFSCRQLQRLEERLSIQIFERTSKIVRLTDDGKAFCDEALALLAQLEDVAFSCATPRDILQVHPALRLELIATTARAVGCCNASIPLPHLVTTEVTVGGVVSAAVFASWSDALALTLPYP